MNDVSKTGLTILFIVTATIGMWLGVTYLLSLVSGWRSLAKRFASADTCEGEKFSFVSATIGFIPLLPVNYSSCLFLTVGTKGFRLALMFPFRFQSPPLVVPWEQIQSVESRRIWLIKHTVIRINDSPVQIKIPFAAGRAIFSACREHGVAHAGAI
jgi:hypothetical protein